MKREKIDELFGLETFDGHKDLKTDEEILAAIADDIESVYYYNDAALKTINISEEIREELREALKKGVLK